MHLVTSYKTRAMTALPSVLPPGLVEAAARRGAPPPPGSRGTAAAPPSALPRQFTGPQRAASPLARGQFATPPPISAQTTGGWLITPQEKAKYDQFFNGIDTAGAGFLNGEQAVRFFSDSGLPEDTLAQIWDLADINSEGRLSRDEFAVAMYLIRQERSKPAGAASLPAFLPQALIPPSLRNQPRAAPQTTAPTFDNAANTSQFPKSATEDLFGLDEPAAPAPASSAPIQTAQTTGGPSAFGQSVSRDPFGASKPASPPPASPQTQPFAPQSATGSSMFKPFMPSSAFGASLAAQHTGSSNTSAQFQQARAVPPPTAMDDLLGEAPEEETKNITNDTTELANMSNQIGNLRNQMQDVQTKKETHSRDLTATNNQKRDLELRLQQFRAQYEQEVRTVKTLEEQLTASRNDTKRLQQEYAMIEGAHQDLFTQHQTVSQQLAADQQENASLKQRISQLNAEIAQLKPQVEKMKADARQQRGMVAINKKQLATNEGEHSTLSGQIDSLRSEAEQWEAQQKAEHEERLRQLEERGTALQEREDHLHAQESQLKERESLLQQREQEHARSVAAAPQARSAVVSPTPSASTNPFFRSAGTPGPTSPGGRVASPSVRAFDDLFGPSFSSQQDPQINAPPTTSFRENEAPVAAASVQSLSSEGRPTPSATPPLASDHVPPPPPESRQFTPGILPMRNVQREASFDDSVRAAAPDSVDDRSVATGPIGSPFDEPNALEHSSFASGEIADVGNQAHDPALQAGHDQSREVAQEFEPLQETESMPGAFPEDGATPMTAQTTGPTAEKVAHDDFESAFAGFDDPAQSKGKEPATEPFPGEAQSAARPFSDEFPAIKELDHGDSDSDSDRGFDDDFTAGPSAGNGAPLEPVITEHIEHAAPAPEENLRPAFTEDSRALTDLPDITAQTSPPTYENSLHPRSGSGHLPPEFGGLLPSREDPTQSPVPHSIPQQVPHTPASDVFHDAGSRPTSDTPDFSGTTTTTTAVPVADRSAFDDDFAEFDDLDEAKEATGEENAFGTESEIRGEEFNPTFDSPTQSISTIHGGAAGGATHGFGGFDDHQRDVQQPTTTSAFGTTQAPQAQSSHDWDAIFSGLDASPNVSTNPASAFDIAPPSTGFPGADNIREEGSAGGLAAPVPQKPQLGRAITNTGEHDDPTVKRLTGMGFSRDKAVKALEDYDYNIDRVG